MSTEFQARVIGERIALDEKVDALFTFIEENLLFDGLSEAEQSRLMNQLRFMCGYTDVLAERIAAFVN